MLTWWILPAESVPQQNIVLEKFRFAPGGYYPPPHEKQLKSLLTGAKAEQQADKSYLITQGKFESFLENGQRDMLVQAPSCRYEEGGDHSIHSPGPLQLQAADGKFSISGDGFRWQTNSSLFISNRVHTVVHPELLQGQNSATAATNKSKANTNGIDIVSEQFDYIGEPGIGNYRKNVHLSGADLDMTAEHLNFLLPMRQKQLQGMTAEGNVTALSAGMRATGQRLAYSPESGLMRVTGEPKWQAALREGYADELSIDRSNRIFRATGNAFLRMNGQSGAASGFLPGMSAPGTNSLSSSNQIVEIHSESYEIRTNSAEFISQVSLIERVGDKPRTTLNCAHLLASFTGSNQVQRMLAEQDVVIAQDEKRFTADSAVFTGTNQVLALQGNPTWRDGDRVGRGDSIFLEGLHGELAVRGNAQLRLPANQIGLSEIAAIAPKPGTPAPTNQFAEISSRDYTLRTNSALFEGGVQVIHPQTKLLCKTLSLDAKPGGNAHNLVAQDSVIFDLQNENDQKIHGTGQKAVYTYSVSGNKTNDTVEFTGDPMLTMPNGTTFRNKVIIFDRASGKVMASGKYSIQGIASTSATNDIALPKSAAKRKRKGST